MDTQTQPRRRLSFSEIEPMLQLAWDSTSLSALKRCPRFYQYSILEGYVTRIESIHLRFGLEYNDALGHFHKQRAKGLDYEDAIVSTVRFALERTWDYDMGRPWTSDEPTKTRESLVRSIIWYLDKFKDDPLETQILNDGKPAIELSFRIHIEINSELTDEPYLMCGHLDRTVNYMGTWVTDFKTTKYALDDKYFNRYTPDNQVSQYSFSGSLMFGSGPIKGVIIDAVQLGVTFSRFQRSHISRTASQLEEWFRDSVIHIRQNETYVANGYWPQNDTACEKYGGCPYRPVCAASPEVRRNLLEGLYTKRSWDPLVVREV